MLTLAIDQEREAKERRRGIRVPQHRPIKLLEPASGRYFGGRTRDVSPVGLQLELPAWTPIAPGRVVSLALGHDGPTELASRRTMTSARVVWVRPLQADTGPTVVAGLEFVRTAAATAAA